MKVKISTEAVWEGERLGAESVIEVPAETYDLNQSWMKATDEKLKKVPPAESAKAAAKDEK